MAKTDWSATQTMGTEGARTNLPGSDAASDWLISGSDYCCPVRNASRLRMRKQSFSFEGEYIRISLSR